MEAGEHGPDRLYQKFRVEKVSTGREIDQSREFVFVLRPETNDRAAIAALKIYASVAFQSGYPELAKQILEQTMRIEEGRPLDPARPLPTTREGWVADPNVHVVDVQGQFANGDLYEPGMVADRYYYYCACGVCGRPRQHRREAVLDSLEHLRVAGPLS